MSVTGMEFLIRGQRIPLPEHVIVYLSPIQPGPMMVCKECKAELLLDCMEHGPKVVGMAVDFGKQHQHAQDEGVDMSWVNL